MANFSSDQAKGPPVRFSPVAGNIGAKAAERGLKPQKQGQGSASSRQPARESAASPHLGYPDFDAHQQPEGDQGQEQPDDNRHLDLVGAWHNVRGLGRDIPWTVWANLTNEYRQLATAGQVPWDLFEDT